jgi:hypothetical protein
MIMWPWPSTNATSSATGRQPGENQLCCSRRCRANDYQMRCAVQARKALPRRRTGECDRALVAKLRDRMVRVDDGVTCET